MIGAVVAMLVLVALGCRLGYVIGNAPVEGLKKEIQRLNQERLKLAQQ